MIQYAEERFSDVKDEIAQLIHEHWLYVSGGEGPELDIDWPLFQRYEESDALHTLTVRSDNQLVGYIIFVLWKAPHYQVLLAHDDAFFLKEEFRKGTTGIKMFVEAEKMLKKYDVYCVIYHEKTRVPMGKIFKYLGYQAREVLWMKEI
jgi:hypothetical protein